jgi:hypothetical protein
MKSFAPQHIVDVSAFIHASHCAQYRSKQWIDECVSILREKLRRNFPHDDCLEADVLDCAAYAERIVCRADVDDPQAVQVDVLRWCAEFADHVEPDGLLRKKSSRIFGGSLFRRRPVDRKASFRAKLPSYLLMANSQHLVTLIVPCPFHGEACPTQKIFREAIGKPNPGQGRLRSE